METEILTRPGILQVLQDTGPIDDFLREQQFLQTVHPHLTSESCYKISANRPDPIRQH